MINNLVMIIGIVINLFLLMAFILLTLFSKEKQDYDVAKVLAVPVLISIYNIIIFMLIASGII